ncbi:class IV lanthionine synthetase LanL [Kitasatospora sp. LaBMicrA B282]|uniref:class IV lanthionine synthetase LanL n=1 Tax=Kitasatospora sp. LaBMicrA B282 TaxID=3420949 RepID=UPI003D143BC3
MPSTTQPGPNPDRAALEQATPPGSAAALAARLDALTAGHRHRRRTQHCWLVLEHPEMPTLPHGWKLHISTRPDLLAEVVELVVPVLLRYRCEAKFAAGAAELRDLNLGRRNPAAVGKAITVYPCPPDVTRLGTELARVLAGRPGPRVPSDRQVHPDAPVYYRYGPIHVAQPAPGTPAADLTLLGPDGRPFPGAATTHYRQPPWAVDPFPTAVAAPPTGLRLGAGRYRVTAGIVRAPHGSVYRAVDATDGRAVVVKQARAHVAEDAAGVDARGRLRHEHRVLRLLAGIDGVPQALDHFRHGTDEYLVTDDCGPRNLRQEVLAHGPYRVPATAGTPAAERDWQPLAARLLRIVDAVHARGVVLCDVKPDNVILDPAGSCHLVDFGISSTADHHPGGGTPGYCAPPDPADTGAAPARPSAAARPADDLYSLGATLHFALTGLDPVVLDPDPAVNRERTLAGLAGLLTAPGQRPVRALLAGLLSLDPTERTAAAQQLRHGVWVTPRRPLPAPPRITPDLLDAVIAHTVAFCVEQAERAVAADGPGDQRPEQLLSLYQGSAGLGRELLRHPEHTGARTAARALARWTATHPARALLPPGLYDGRLGVELFLAEAAASAGPEADPAADAATHPLRPRTGRAGDQIAGAAGIGAGHLLLAELARAAHRTAAADRHLALATACGRGLLDGGYGLEPLAGPGGRSRPDAAAFTDGFAHGRAGVVDFLLALHRATGDPAVGAAAERLLAELAAATPELVRAAAHPGATRRYGSWCRGLAGIGGVLLRAARRQEDARLLDLAVTTARSCRLLAPRMGQVGRCCGLAGPGELLLDLAAATGDGAFTTAAEQVAALILTRSAGSLDRPLFPDGSLAAASASWSGGSTGVLAFLRRLRTGAPADLH